MRSPPGEERTRSSPVPTRDAEHRGRRPRSHTTTPASRSDAPVVGVEHRAATARDHERLGRRARRRRPRRARARGTAARPRCRRARRHVMPARRLDELVGVDEGPAEQLGAALPDRRLARAHQPDEHEVPRSAHRRHVTAATRRTRRGCARARRASRRRTCEWPRCASTSATIVSATTPDAGTAVTSVRSLNETVSSLVSVSTVLQHRAVERGQRLHRDAGDEQPAGGHPALGAAGTASSRACTRRRRRPRGSRRGPRCRARPRPRSRRRSRRPSSPGCSSAPGRAGRRSCGPSARASRGPGGTP